MFRLSGDSTGKSILRIEVFVLLGVCIEDYQ